MWRVCWRLQLAVFIVVSLTVCSRGQEVKASHSSEQIEQNPQTLTGCLDKSEQANEFTLHAEDGKVWQVKGDSRALLAQVGHTVTVFGDSHYPEYQIEPCERWLSGRSTRSSLIAKPLTVCGSSLRLLTEYRHLALDPATCRFRNQVEKGCYCWLSAS